MANDPAPSRRTHNAPFHVLVAAVTAAERGEPMPSTAELARRIGCVAHGVAMAVARLEDAGVLKRLHEVGGRRRLLIVQTGRATAIAE